MQEFRSVVLEKDTALSKSEELCEFYEGSYGDLYHGDERLLKKINESDKVVLRVNSSNAIGAAAIICQDRITAPGTSPERRLFTESRTERMMGLLAACGEIEKSTWMTVGVEYERMQETANRAGMQKAKTVYPILGMLERTFESEKYSFTGDNEGNIIVRKSLPNGSYYNQNAWMFPVGGEI